MGFPADVADLLYALAAGDGGDGDLALQLAGLLAGALAAVPSSVGVTVIVDLHGVPVALSNQVDAPGPVLSSMALRLPSRSGRRTAIGSVLVLYATERNVFGSVVDDLLELLDLDPRRVMIDGHLDLPAPDEAGRTLSEQLEDLSVVNLALGVLVDHGLLPPAGHAELERIAAAADCALPSAARMVLAAVRRTPPAA